MESAPDCSQPLGTVRIWILPANSRKLPRIKKGGPQLSEAFWLPLPSFTFRWLPLVTEHLPKASDSEGERMVSRRGAETAEGGRAKAYIGVWNAVLNQWISEGRCTRPFLTAQDYAKASQMQI